MIPKKRLLVTEFPIYFILISALIFPGAFILKAQKNQQVKPSAACSDLGGENGWGAWQALEGANHYNTAGAPLFLTPVTLPTSPRFNLTTGAGLDPCTPGPAPGSPPVPVVCPFPGFGNTSIQIGQPQADGIAGGCAAPPGSGRGRA